MKLGKLIIYLDSGNGKASSTAWQRLRLLSKSGEVAVITPGPLNKSLPLKWTHYSGWTNLIEPLKKASKCRFKGLLLVNWQNHVRSQKRSPDLILDEILVFSRCCKYQAHTTLVVLNEPGPKMSKPSAYGILNHKIRKLFLEMADETVAAGTEKKVRLYRRPPLKKIARKGKLRRTGSLV